MVKSYSIIVYSCINAMLLSLVLAILHSPAAEARCPNGYHMSPSGDCEKVTQTGDLPRCPNGYYRSPSGDCERKSEATGKNNDRLSFQSSEIPLTQISECRGDADCFRGTVTEIVDGDTIDVNNVRIRLSMVNTPERGEVDTMKPLSLRDLYVQWELKH